MIGATDFASEMRDTIDVVLAALTDRKRLVERRPMLVTAVNGGRVNLTDQSGNPDIHTDVWVYPGATGITAGVHVDVDYVGGRVRAVVGLTPPPT